MVNNRTMQQWDEIELAPIILIHSGEPVYGDRAVDTLKSRLREHTPELAVTELDAACYDAGALSVYTSPSLFGEPRAVVLGHLEQLNAALQKDLLDYLEHPEAEVTLILRHNSGAGTGSGQRGKKLLDALKKAKVPTITIAQVKKAADKAKAVQADVRAAGRSISSSAVAALVDALGSDLRELLVGAKQLLADVQGTIDEADVHTYFAGRIEATGYAVADAACAGRTGQAIEMARHAMSTGVSPVAIVAAIGSNVRRLAQVLGMRSAGGRFIGQRVALSMPPWQIDKAKRELRGWSGAGLAAAIQAIAQADAEVKGASRDPGYAVEKAIIEVARFRRRGN